jgi:hypothetical protein
MKIRIECLPEPQLLFGNSTTGLEPRRVLATSGPADVGRRSEIRVAVVGLPDDVDAAARWIEKLNDFIPAREANAVRFRHWPGAQRAFGVRFVVESRFVRALDENRIAAAIKQASSTAGFEELVGTFDDRIHGLFGDVAPDCVVVCLPEEIADLRVHNPGLSPEERRALERLRAEEEDLQLSLFQPTPEELRAAEELRTQADDLLFRSFYRALKARAQIDDNPVPLQVLRRETIDRPDEKGQGVATRAWNFAASVYYKAGGLPWRPRELPNNTCFIGISFHHLKRRTGSLVYASLAQAFSSEVEPFALKGATIPHHQRRDLQPYLTEAQTAALIRDVIRKYEGRAGTLPSRIVVHKTSMYQPEEESGFRMGAHGSVPAVDLVWFRNTPFRLIRKGFQEPWRGTFCHVGDERYLFTSGYVPWWNEYPGPHIPAPVQLGACGETDLRQRASEILALSKMNWNNTEGISRYPVTLSFAKRVGQLMTELPDDCTPNPSYRYYM